MGLDPRYIPLFHLQQEFVDKTTGLPLQSGVVYSWQDNNRNNLKPLYQLSGAPPNYSFTALPNPITLTNGGTASNGATDDIVWYAFPYDANGDPDNYFIQVFAEPSVPPVPPVGTPILTREAVPGVTTSANPATVSVNNSTNELVNSQFVDVLFDPAQGMTITYIAGTTNVQIASGWSIRIIASGGGTVNVARTSVQGSLNYATNPPYYLTVTPGGANITSLMLVQTLTNNPDIFAGQFVNAGILLAPVPNPQVSIFYAPQGVQVNPPLITAQNFMAVWAYFNHTNAAALPLGFNTETANTGYTEIQIVLSPLSATSFSSVQITALSTFESSLAYKQTSVIQQQNETFFFFEPELAAKPIPSYLIGWDFPMNPAQFFGDHVPAQALGNASSYYAWDQTIIFQQLTNGVIVSRDAASLGINIEANVTGQFALIQYIDLPTAREIINGNASVYIEGFTSANPYIATATLWSTDDANLPDLKTPNFDSAVTALNATGRPTMGNGNWSEITRGDLGNAQFNITSTANKFTFSGFTGDGLIEQFTATYIAIVIGFSSVTAGDSITINSVGLCSGDIATKPAPKTQAETLLDTQTYYYKTFGTNIEPIQNAGVDTGYLFWALVNAARGTYFQLIYPTTMRKLPVVTLYNPEAANAQVRNISTGTDCSGSTANSVDSGPTQKQVVISATPPGGATAADLIGVHVTADARLGIVN